ncbi:hypothetical protein E2C01_004477 [Portunus trituberculatus]|uniref:Uncharacterized protein n=1 Tax=Portunus trituberculatus TaxID=210409 RepID=A0A5B7CQ36_PORTR|nr:hypothetical protein [Portunus trituberculatus]
MAILASQDTATACLSHISNIINHYPPSTPLNYLLPKRDPIPSLSPPTRLSLATLASQEHPQHTPPRASHPLTCLSGIHSGSFNSKGLLPHSLMGTILSPDLERRSLFPGEDVAAMFRDF